MNKKQNQIENQNLLIQRNNELNSLNEMNNINLIKELINSLKEKINTYEKQIRKLIDDKVKLQMDISLFFISNTFILFIFNNLIKINFYEFNYPSKFILKEKR